MEQNIAFNRCMDFLARMIEKYAASTDLALLVQQQPDEEEE